MSIRDKKYIVIKNAISKEMAKFGYEYLKNKKVARDTLIMTEQLNPMSEEWGEMGDGQAPMSFSNYGDLFMDSLLPFLKSKVEKHAKLKLIEAYSYCRIYYKGSELRRHKDRFSCEISSTLHLGGSEWPIFVDPNPKNGYTDEEKGYQPGCQEGVEVILKPGDMMIYMGCECEHWRDILFDEECAQVFLHYNDVNTKGAEENKFDMRPCIGVPSYMKGIKIQ